MSRKHIKAGKKKRDDDDSKDLRITCDSKRGETFGIITKVENSRYRVKTFYSQNLVDEKSNKEMEGEFMCTLRTKQRQREFKHLQQGTIVVFIPCHVSLKVGKYLGDITHILSNKQVQDTIKSNNPQANLLKSLVGNESKNSNSKDEEVEFDFNEI